ncbi:MAG: CoA transferase [SAR202 cluster bacterium]|jgi:crotonobetainyl-CoA:carnitine CoA-transferase CaiB-like acyl-CoA transferase|nr:CoA transferase [SAR202 cluster bacterium]MDP6713463.1 CoA transferase [SAR202 cluster bacterium]
MSVKLPLEGVRIVEMSQLIAIPYAAKLLSDMGAQVIRIESCVRLENYRGTAFYDDRVDGEWWNRSINFYEQNRNKHSLALDLTKPEGQQALIELIAVSDVFAENFTPRVISNFGLDYEKLREVKPDLIMVSSTGYGHTGPWSNFGAIGFGTEATSGLAHMTGYQGAAPIVPEIPYTDYTAAEHTTFAIAAALVHRARTGQGQFIDVSQSQTLSATIPDALMDYTVNGRIRDRIGNGSCTFAPQGCYECQGRENFIAISAETDAQWSALCNVLGAPEWTDDPRFASAETRLSNQHSLDEMIGKKTREWDKRDLERELQSQKVSAGAVLDGKELLFDPHLNERGFFEVVEHPESTEIPPLPYGSRPWKFSETPGRIHRSAPLLGEHNRWALTDVLGRSHGNVAAMKESGAIGETPALPKPVTQLSPDALLKLGRIVRHDPDFKQQVQRKFGDG